MLNAPPPGCGTTEKSGNVNFSPDGMLSKWMNTLSRTRWANAMPAFSLEVFFNRPRKAFKR